MKRFVIFASIILSVALVYFANANQTSNYVVAYYFHGENRCELDLNIENAFTEFFPENYQGFLDNGSLDFQVINYEKEGNTHYEKIFNLVAQNLIIARYENNALKEFKNLEDIWTKIGDPEEFNKYLKDELDAYLR